MKKAISALLLFAIILACLPISASAGTVQGSVPTRTLSMNSRGSDVRWLQSALNNYRDYGLSVDGEFGNATRAAVCNFQACEGLTVDGIFGPASRAKLLQRYSDHSWSWQRINHPICDQTWAAAFAEMIIKNPNIELDKGHTEGKIDNASPYNNIIDTYYYQSASRSNYGTAPDGRVALSVNLLRMLIDLQQRYGKVRVSELCGGNHSHGSAHYDGRAMDITDIGGAVSRSRGKEIYNYLISRGYRLNNIFGGTVYEDASHYHIELLN